MTGLGATRESGHSPSEAVGHRVLATCEPVDVHGGLGRDGEAVGVLVTCEPVHGWRSAHEELGRDNAYRIP